MLFSPRRSIAHTMLNRIRALFGRRRDGASNLADQRYLDSMSAAQLESDLGLIRIEEGRYRPVPWLHGR